MHPVRTHTPHGHASRRIAPLRHRVSMASGACAPRTQGHTSPVPLCATPATAESCALPTAARHRVLCTTFDHVGVYTLKPATRPP
jgi:hypothetical protein